MEFNIRDEFKPIVNRWLKANPMAAHILGIHEYDGQLPDYSPQFITKRIQELNEDLKILDAIPAPDSKDSFEKGLIQLKLEEELFRLTEYREYEENPVVYVFPLALIETSYVSRSFDSIDNRIKSIISIEKQIPDFLKTARENLKESLPAPKITMAVQFLKGIITFLKDNLISFIVKSDDESLIQEWSEVNLSAVAALADFFEDLNNIYLPKSHNNFAMGKEKFLKLLAKTEFVNLDLEHLLKVGEDNLEKNYKQLVAILQEKGKEYLSQVQNECPSEDQLLPWVSESLNRTRNFIIQADLVTLPTTEQCKVIQTPEFARGFAFAAMSTPGPFEKDEASEAYYWVTPPDPNWPEMKKKEFLKFFSKAFLEMVTIHEVWPGHYLQLLYNKTTESDITKLFARSTTMIEGYAHYAEEMVYDAGYEPFDRTKLKVGQLLGALIRNCRYVAAIKMHTMGMTVEEAKQLFMEKAMMTEPSATIEANRGTINPMYLNYTLGKLLILKLREDYKKEKGEHYSLKEFHDTMLKHGSPPITLLRKVMLENPGDENDIL